MGNKKGQIAVEYMVLIGFIAIMLAISIFAITKFSSSSLNAVFLDKVEDVGDTLVQNGREMYFLGLFSKVVVTVTMPGGVEDMAFLDIDTGSVREHHIVFYYTSEEGQYTKLFVPSEVPIITENCDDGTSSFTECATNTCVYCSLYPNDYNKGPKNFEIVHVLEPVSGERKINITSVSL